MLMFSLCTNELSYLILSAVGSYFDIITVQAPHPPSLQPCLVPVKRTIQGEKFGQE